MATQNGTPVNFSFQSAAGITITEISGILLQNASYKKMATRKLVMDGAGERTSSIWHDAYTTSTLKWKVKGTGLADALTNTTLKARGSFVTITACASMPELVSASKYEVVDGEVSGSNEDVKEISLEIELAANIQAAAGA